MERGTPIERADRVKRGSTSDGGAERQDPQAFKKLLQQYDYKIPDSFIAQNPASPRDSAKLLVYDRKANKTQIDTFKNLVRYLPKNSVLVFNKTKVIPARIVAHKPTGGKVELLFIRKTKSQLVFLANKKLEVGLKITAGKYFFIVQEKLEKEYSLTPSFPIENYSQILESIGITPLPPYIKHTNLTEKKLRIEYQTIFAKEKGSVAAPTASLHFTKALLKKIEKAGHKIYFVTLHVNLGTFSPLEEKQVKEKKLHEEYYEIDRKTAKELNIAKKLGYPIIAVGTTVVRTLESAANNTKELKKLYGTSHLFLTENSKLQFVESVITNFHVPKSSLLMLVAAFLGRKKLFALYETAQKENFRFFSFGDGMFIK